MDVGHSEYNVVVSILKVWWKLASVDIFGVISPREIFRGGMWWNGIEGERKYMHNCLVLKVNIFIMAAGSEDKRDKTEVTKCREEKGSSATSVRGQRGPGTTRSRTSSRMATVLCSVHEGKAS